jgi:predicted nucleic acid-binding protein
MRKVFLDTNIILDLLAERVPFYTEAAELFSLADKKKIKLFISAISLANTYYILSKQNSDNEVRSILRKFKVLVTVLEINDKISDLALNSDFKDFEDAIQYFTALENDLEVIITRNQSDFKGSTIPVLNAGELIKML